MPRFLRNPWFLFGLGLWQLVVMFTPVSLYGFWTDVVVLLSWGGLLVRSAFFDPEHDHGCDGWQVRSLSFLSSGSSR